MQLHTTPLKNVAIGIYDGPHATPKESDNGPIFLGIKNVTADGRLDLSEIRHVAEEDFARWTRRVTPQKDDLVFSYEATLHLYARIPDNFLGCLGRRMALIRPDIEKIDPRFFHYYLLSPRWREKMEAITIIGATVNRIPLTLVPDVEVSIPDLATQTRIADILSAYDELIENNGRRIALLEQATRELYREWFVRLRFPGHEHVKIIDGVPEGCEMKALRDICLLRAGNVFKPNYQGQTRGDLPFIKVRDFNAPGNCLAVTVADNWVSQTDSDSFKGRPFPPGTVVFAKIGEAIRQNRVRLLVRDTLIDNNLMGAIPRGVSSAFLYCLLSNYDLANTASGAAVPFLSAGVLNAIPFLAPSPKIDIAFSEHIDGLLTQIQVLQHQSTQASHARDLLLPHLMNGTIPV